jgi:hypothetical protein
VPRGGDTGPRKSLRRIGRVTDGRSVAEKVTLIGRRGRRARDRAWRCVSQSPSRAAPCGDLAHGRRSPIASGALATARVEGCTGCGRGHRRSGAQRDRPHGATRSAASRPTPACDRRRAPANDAEHESESESCIKGLLVQVLSVCILVSKKSIARATAFRVNGAGRFIRGLSEFAKMRQSVDRRMPLRTCWGRASHAHRQCRQSL